MNAQQGWTTTECGAGCFVANQVINAETSTDGSNSLKITQETAFGGQANPVVGGFYNYAAPVSNTSAVFSADINISQQDANSSDYLFGLVNTVAGSFRTYIRFTFEGDIVVLVLDALGTVILEDTNADWSPNTWFNVRIEITGANVEFFIDNTSIYNGLLATVGDVNNVRFVHDNFQGFAYFDNFRTNNEPTAAVNEFNSNIFTHSYNKDSDVLTIDSSALAFFNIQLYNLLGQEVINKKLSQTTETLSLAGLQDGVYLAKVTIENQVKTLKFLKN